MRAAPFHSFSAPLIKGRFVRREKRFLAHVLLPDGTPSIAHCPNTGSMKSCLQEGAPVILHDSLNPDRKYPLTLKAIRIGRHWVGVDTGVPNRLGELALKTGYLPAFEGCVEVARERYISEHTRIDLFARAPDLPDLYVEVKNVTLVEDGAARFPDAVTSRGLKHLEELARLVGEGKRAAMLYVVQRGDGNFFEPARDIDPAYAAGLEMAARSGVGIIALACKVTERGVSLGKPLPVRL